MRLTDVFSETAAALSSNKARSGLTMLGIVIGISSVIALVGVGQGATASVTASISSLGSNLLVVSPGSSSTAGPVSGGAGSAETLTVADGTAIKSNVSDAEAVAPVLSKRYQVTATSNNTNTSVLGTTADYAAVRDLTIDSGNFLSDQQDQQGALVAVLGPTVRDTLFGTDANAINQFIKINGVQFKVIGVTKAKGGSGFTTPDNNIYVPLLTAQRYLAGVTASISEIDIEASSAATINEAQAEITALLLTRHNISDPTNADFTVVNQADIVSSLSTVTSTLTLLLGAIAGISLLVGGIGIMNMMLTTVTERTREIGLRKAIGAKSRDISVQFLTEAIMLTFIGGLIGVTLGLGIAITITRLGIITATVTWQSVVLSFGVSALVGIVFGFYPAQRAAKLKPIEALKYE
jgi:putative ABC transport system permease protein